MDDAPDTKKDLPDAPDTRKNQEIHASLAVTQGNPKVVLTEGNDSTIVGIDKVNVAGAAISSGIYKGAELAVTAGFWNVLWQARDPQIKNSFKKFFSSRDEFLFKDRSFNKWTGLGLGVGFAVGAITAALGATQHNRKAEGFAAEVEAAKTAVKANSSGVGQSK